MEKIEERKIVPIAAMISAGKSKLLNVILNINFLESKSGIGTKFVNILRYNPNIEKPCFYHLTLQNEKGKYVFYKDPAYEPKIGEEKIIEENLKINKILLENNKVNYDDIFYITELNSVGFIKDKNYMLTHDLCDIPGLSEYQEKDNNTNKEEEKELRDINTNKEEKKELKDDELEEKLKKGQEFGMVYKPKRLNNSFKLKNENKNEDEIFYNIDIEKESIILLKFLKELKIILMEQLLY